MIRSGAAWSGPFGLLMAGNVLLPGENARIAPTPLDRWLATEAEGGRAGGRYFHRDHEEQPTAAALDDVAAARLWTESEKLLATLGI